MVPSFSRPTASSHERVSLAQRELGVPIAEAAVAGASMRFRAVVMTSVAFVLSFVPLVVATGAASISRQDVGTPVFAGMLAASAIGIFLILMLYVTFQTTREWTAARCGKAPRRAAEQPRS